jgi:hypothetical protein
MEHHGEAGKSEHSSLANRIALALFVVVLGFFLWTEHQAHLLGALPYLILLLCPIIHIFMHKGHGKGH